jgi:hypothetical protein
MTDAGRRMMIFGAMPLKQNEPNDACDCKAAMATDERVIGGKNIMWIQLVGGIDNIGMTKC